MNPFTAIRKSLQGAGAILICLLTLALLGILVTITIRSFITNGWITWAYILGTLAFFALLGFASVGTEKLGSWWRKREEAYHLNLRKKKWDAGTPDLDPAPLLWGSTYRNPYHRLNEYSIEKFAPREYYEQNEHKYLAALPTNTEEEE